MTFKGKNHLLRGEHEESGVMGVEGGGEGARLNPQVAVSPNVADSHVGGS